MPAARYWRLVAIEAHGGADLELSALHLYDAAGRADSTSTLTSTIAPTAGALAALQDEDLASTCRFAAAAVRASGFAIVWDFGAGNTADVIGPRLAGPALATFLASCTLQCSDDGLLWQLVADFARFDWPGAAAYTNAPTALDDPHWNKVSLLLHMDGADGSTAFTDSSGAPIAAVAMGNAKISSAKSAFGGASGFFDGSANTRLDVSSSALSFASGDDFCIEGWMFPSAITTYAYLCGSRTGFENVQLCRVESANGQVISALSAGDVLVSAAVPRNAWGHFALVRASGTLSFYYNGVLQASKASATAFAVTAIGAGLGIPGSQYIDDLRITKGAARYTTNFTPPTAPFPGAHSAGGPVFLPPLLRAPTPERARIAASAPVPPHSTLSAPRLLTARDMEFAGSGTASATGTIYGSTAIKGSPNSPVRAKVSLLRARDLLLVQQTWSDPATGAYAFHGLDPAEKYTTLAEYPTGDYRAVAADQLTPDIEEARAP